MKLDRIHQIAIHAQDLDEPHLIHRNDSGVFGKPGEKERMEFFLDPSGNVLTLASRRR